MDQLALEAAEEMPCHGVVVGIALAGHALPDSVGRQPLPEGLGSVLDAPVIVKDRPLDGLQRRTAMSMASSVGAVSIRSEKA